MQQISQPQQQMMNQNIQMQMGNPQQIPQNRQLYQIVQSNSTPTRCEEFSKFFTGSYNIPLIVFLILMGSSSFLILSLLLSAVFPTYFLTYSALGNFIFALFVWAPMAIKIERNTSTVRYGLLYLINNSILSICTLSFPLGLQKIWNFVLFETLLIALTNTDKKMKFFCCKISGKALIVCSIIYHFIFNNFFILSLSVTIIYTFIYKKSLINKFAISNEKVNKIENWCLVSWLKKNLITFITLQEILEKGQQKQPLVQNSNVSNPSNSSFVPANMYPNYYSGVASNIQQIQPMQNMQPNETERSVDSNANLQ